MKILVTGANGYLGQGVVKSLSNHSVEIVATDLNTDNINVEAIKIDCDIFELDNPYEFFSEPDILVHLACRDGFKHYSDRHITDLPRHYKFIEKMLKSGLKKIVVMGSMHEIGFYEGSIDENTPCNSTTPYGISKNALRELTCMLAKNNNAEFQWLRGFYIVGNSKFGDSIFSKITAAAANGDKEFPFTLGQNQFDFIDYEEFCNQVAATVLQSEINGIINICSGNPEKLSDRVERFIVENNFDIKLKYGAFPDRPYESKAMWGNCNKIKKILDNKSITQNDSNYK